MSVSMGCSTKNDERKNSVEYGERKQKNVWRNLTKLKILSPAYILPSGTHNMSAGLWFSVASRCVEK